MSHFWTADRVGFLKSAWRNGASMQEIADQLGCSRGAIAGQLHRRGLFSIAGGWTEQKRAKARAFADRWNSDPANKAFHRYETIRGQRESRSVVE